MASSYKMVYYNEVKNYTNVESDQIICCEDFGGKWSYNKENGLMYVLMYVFCISEYEP